MRVDETALRHGEVNLAEHRGIELAGAALGLEVRGAALARPPAAAQRGGGATQRTSTRRRAGQL